MKAIKKQKRISFICAILAAILFGIFAISSISSKKAHALVPDYNGESNTIYYLTDYCEVIAPDRLAYEFPNYNIIIDRKSMDEQQFTNMVYEQYFEWFGYNCVVIIDIKTFMPSPYVLYDLFYELKSQDCVTVFVTAYDYYNNYDEETDTYGDTLFMDYVDISIDDSDYCRLVSYVFNAMQYQYNDNADLNRSAYIIDGFLVDTAQNWGADMDTLCDNSLFLDLFMKELICWIETPYIYDPNRYDSCEEIAETLRSFYEVRLLVYLGNNAFVDILTWEVFNCYDIEDFKYHDIFCIDYVSAYGFWEYSQEFYDYFIIKSLAGIEIPTMYGLLVDMPIYGVGLPVITETQLANLYGIEWDYAAIELLDNLHEMIVE